MKKRPRAIVITVGILEIGGTDEFLTDFTCDSRAGAGMKNDRFI